MTSFNYKKELKLCSQWLSAKTKEDIFLNASQVKISRLMTDRGQHWIPGMASAFQMLSTWYAHSGIEMIGRNQVQGWASLSHALSFEYWHCRIVMALVDKDVREDKPLRVTFRNVGHAMLSALFCLEACEIHCMGRRYLDWIDAYPKFIYNDNGFDFFNTRLFTIYESGKTHSEFPARLLSKGPFGKIFEDWDHLDSKGEGILGLCDFHLERMSEHHDYDVAEYGAIPFSIVPIEYLALCRVRKTMGLKTAKPDHPLLNTPFSAPPDPLPVVEDVLLANALTAIREELTNF